MTITRRFASVWLAPLAVGLAVAGCSKAEEAKVEAPPAAPTTATAAATGAYPLTVCLVAGEKLGSMGDPVVYIHEGREVRFCCASCEATFKKDPAKYLAKLDDAIKNGPATQPMTH